MNTEQKLKAAEAKAAAAETAHKDAQAQLESALATLKADGSEKARKAVLAAEDALRLASTELTWALEALEQARADHEEAERQAALARYAESERASSVDAFRAQVAPLANEAAKLSRRLAEITAQGADLAAAFTSQRTALASQAREVGVTPPPVPEFAKIFAAETALASGRQPAEVLAELFGSEPLRGVNAAALLAVAYQGRQPREVEALLHRLRDAERRREACTRRLVNEGSDLDTNCSPSAFSSFQGVSRECDETRTKLADLGFQAAADEISIDPLAAELARLSEPDLIKAARLIDSYLAADWARAADELSRRDPVANRHAAQTARLELVRLGCPEVAAAMPRASYGNQSRAGGSLTAY